MICRVVWHVYWPQPSGIFLRGTVKISEVQMLLLQASLRDVVNLSDSQRFVEAFPSLRLWGGPKTSNHSWSFEGSCCINTWAVLGPWHPILKVKHPNLQPCHPELERRLWKKPTAIIADIVRTHSNNHQSYPIIESCYLIHEQRHKFRMGLSTSCIVCQPLFWTWIVGKYDTGLKKSKISKIFGPSS